MHSADATASKFVHLHLHTEYSLLDGACRIRDVVARAKAFGMPAVAISDHGNLFGAIEFYTAARDAGIKPIIGCELYLAPGDRRDKEHRGVRDGGYHLLLLAMNREGYRNLLKLASIAYLEGFYYKPRIDKAALREFNAGLLCTSTCLGGEIPQQLLKTDARQARRLAEEYLDIFGPDRFFIELQNHNLPDQRKINPELNEIARRLGVATIATNDVHYLLQEDHAAHDVLCCINTRSRVSDENRFKFDSQEFYFKSPAEMHAAMLEYPEALANTLHVAGMCNLEFDFSKRYAPVYHPPDGKTPDDFLRELTLAGARERYPQMTPELQERIDYELGVIRDKGFSSYFLIVWDFVRYARQNDIPVSARGSACSTVVGYCLGITGADPLRYGLYFERFMDPERDEMPDIDIDLCQDRRAEVIDYVRRKYGHVAQIITFGRLKAKAAVRDICRAMDVPLAEADRIAKLVPDELKMTISKAIQQEPQLKAAYEGDKRIREVLDYGRKLEGLARHASVHAAGVVIADLPLDELVPLYRASDSPDIVTQFEGPTVEKVGLLKMDFLGLKTLSQIHLTCKLVERHHGVKIDVEKLDLADPFVYALLARGETRGVFQFESGGMCNVLMKMKPNRIEDLIAANALFRPGPMAYIDDYIARKHGRPWSTPHEIMTEVLRETYGILVYQEQVSRLVAQLGDVPLRRAFRLAKAISKKKESMINAERGPFIEGCIRHGLSQATAEEIFADILKFGGYAFNKAHATGYAIVAYQTAALKAYYPVEFMAALLTYESGNNAKLAEYIDDCRRLRQPDGSTGILVLPPDVNESDEGFTVVYAPAPSAAAGNGSAGANGRNGRDSSAEARPAAPPRLAAAACGDGAPPREARRGSIRFGLGAISGLGHKAVQAILAARRNGGRFRDIFDFCERVDLTHINKGVLEALIKAGAFDSTGYMRRALMDVVEYALEAGQVAARDRRNGQLDMFGGALAAAPIRRIGTAEWSDSEMLAYEKETLGFYITRHPLTQYAEWIQRLGTADTAAMASMRDGDRILIGGLITTVRFVPVKSGRSAGRKMLIAVLEDFVGSTEVVVFPDQLPGMQEQLAPDAVVFIDGQVDRKRETPCLRVERVIPIELARQRLVKSVCVRVEPSDADPLLAELQGVCRAFRGNCPLFLQVTSPEGWVVTMRSRVGGVEPSEDFFARVTGLLGRDRVFCVGPRGVLSAG